jgi:hypothetical protein
MVVGSRVAAQVPADPTQRRFRVDASSLRPGQLTYQTTVVRDTIGSPAGNRMVTLSDTSYGGAPAWLIVERRDGDGIIIADSLVAARVDFRPMHWVSTNGPARLGAEFVGDSIYAVVTSPVGRRSIVALSTPGTLVNAAALETALRLLPLQSGWQDSTTALAITVGSNVGLFTRLAVTGEETVTVPAGSFDCWIVTATSEAGQAIYWVSKRDPVVVRSSQVVASLGGARVLNELTGRF